MEAVEHNRYVLSEANDGLKRKDEMIDLAMISISKSFNKTSKDEVIQFICVILKNTLLSY